MPLIKIFDHLWVKNFEKKYNLSKPVPVVAKVAAVAKEPKEKELEK